jgi:hypothetical protein
MAINAVLGGSALETVQGLSQQFHVIEIEWGLDGTEFFDKSVSNWHNLKGGNAANVHLFSDVPISGEEITGLKDIKAQ